MISVSTKVLQDMDRMAKRSRLYHSEYIDLHKDYGFVYHG